MYKAGDLWLREKRQLTLNQFKVMDIPPEHGSRPEPASPTDAAVQDFKRVSDGEPEFIVRLESPILFEN